MHFQQLHQAAQPKGCVSLIWTIFTYVLGILFFVIFFLEGIVWNKPFNP